MQVRSRDPAGHAHGSDNVPLRKLLPGFNLGAIPMAIHTDQALTVIDKHGIAIEKIVA